MVIWGIWWDGAFWFSTGPKRARRKISPLSRIVCIGTEKADEAVIVEGTATEITDRAEWKRMGEFYDKKYGGKLLPLLESSGGSVFRIEPKVAFGQDEHAEDFVQAATKLDVLTKWTFLWGTAAALGTRCTDESVSR